MVKRLEQVAALVVAAGLAIVSYWLFFSCFCFVSFALSVSRPPPPPPPAPQRSRGRPGP